MLPSNQNPNTDEKERPVSLSFSLSTVKPSSPELLVEQVFKGLQQILKKRFVSSEKQKIHNKPSRYNFACPYCGDSHTDDYKKRGNLYYGESFYYKCYNCGKYASVEKFMRDFAQALSADEIALSRELEKKNVQLKKDFDISYFFNRDSLINIAVEREEIEYANKLMPLDKSDIYVYLQKRLQPDMSRFSWDPKKEQLYIFNLIPDTNRVLGYQIRNFKHSPKYMTYQLTKIYEMLGREVSEDLDEANEISTYFGALSLDLNRPITVFEGPLDSFLMRNAVATCSSNIDFPFETSNIRYMYDYDKAGVTAALSRANEGKSVFLWKKLLTDVGINNLNGKKMDLTDLLVLCKRKGIKLPKLGDYFSKNKYDIYEI
jgi:hypothetical protein